jgi:hypothetical protein
MAKRLTKIILSLIGSIAVCFGSSLIAYHKGVQNNQIRKVDIRDFNNDGYKDVAIITGDNLKEIDKNIHFFYSTGERGFGLLDYSHSAPVPKKGLPMYDLIHALEKMPKEE